MLIEEYLQDLKSSIESFSIINNFTINLDKRGDYLGFLAGEIVFRDNSLLMWREFKVKCGTRDVFLSIDLL